MYIMFLSQELLNIRKKRTNCKIESREASKTCRWQSGLFTTSTPTPASLGQYDDGDKQWHDLTHKKFKLLHLTPGTRGSAKRLSASAPTLNTNPGVCTCACAA